MGWSKRNVVAESLQRLAEGKYHDPRVQAAFDAAVGSQEPLPYQACGPRWKPSSSLPERIKFWAVFGGAFKWQDVTCTPQELSDAATAFERRYRHPAA